MGGQPIQVVPDLEDPELENPIAVLPDEHMTLDDFVKLGKVPWEMRSERIRQTFPSVDQVDWDQVLERDIDLYARMVRDVIKLEQAPSGRPGPRPSLDVNAGTRRVMQLLGQDFTTQPFPEALRTLAGERSVRHLARHVGLNQTLTYRLLSGTIEPDGFAMRACAHAFGKHPSYFLEWRILYIVGAISRRLEWSPDSTIDLFQTLDEQRKAAG